MNKQMSLSFIHEELKEVKMHKREFLEKMDAILPWGLCKIYCVNSKSMVQLQFNAVVESNTHARHLYERLGFTLLGTIPEGFLMKDGHYENICVYYQTLKK